MNRSTRREMGQTCLVEEPSEKSDEPELADILASSIVSWTKGRGSDSNDLSGQG